jgi:hypothetical protein
VIADVREAQMRTLLQAVLDALRSLAGPGALGNAAFEVERANRSSADVEAQLGRVLDFPPRAA